MFASLFFILLVEILHVLRCILYSNILNNQKIFMAMKYFERLTCLILVHFRTGSDAYCCLT